MHEGIKHKIVERGKATRFSLGGRNCPLVAQRRASRPWSIHHAVRRLAAMTFDDVTPPLICTNTLRRNFTGSRSTLTGAEMIAIELFIAALSGDIKAMQKLVNMIDN